MQNITCGEVHDKVLAKGLEAVTYLAIEFARSSIESTLRRRRLNLASLER